jgi:hypothetical protein
MRICEGHEVVYGRSLWELRLPSLSQIFTGIVGVEILLF